MRHLLITIAAVVLVGCGNPEAVKELFIAADDGNIELVKKLLSQGVPVNAKIEPNGETALFVAANRRNKEVVEVLISEGADVNAKTTAGRFTPLHEVRSKEIAELLIDNGADVNATNDNGDTPLDSAIKNKRNEAADLLRKHGGKTGKELKAGGK